MVSNSNAVSVKDLEKRFGSFIAVDRISFEVEKGRIYGFLGPNGAGKSTTIRMLCGIITPTSGFIWASMMCLRLDGKSVWNGLWK